MGDLNKIKDEKVRRLAETLRSSGLAASDSEAVRMAENMSHTGGKVNKNFEEKREQSIMGLSHLHKTSKKEPVVVEEDCNCDSGCECEKGKCDCEKEALPQDEVVNQTEMGDSFSDEPELSKITVNEAVEAEVVPKVEDSDFNQEVQADDVEDLEVPAPPEYNMPADLPVQDGAQEAPEPKKAPVIEEPEAKEKPVEEKKEEKPAPKKDLNKFQEAKVDLGAVFKYKG